MRDEVRNVGGVFGDDAGVGDLAARAVVGEQGGRAGPGLHVEAQAGLGRRPVDARDAARERQRNLAHRRARIAQLVDAEVEPVAVLDVESVGGAEDAFDLLVAVGEDRHRLLLRPRQIVGQHAPVGHVLHQRVEAGPAQRELGGAAGREVVGGADQLRPVGSVGGPDVDRGRVGRAGRVDRDQERLAGDGLDPVEAVDRNHGRPLDAGPEDGPVALGIGSEHVEVDALVLVHRLRLRPGRRDLQAAVVERAAVVAPGGRAVLRAGDGVRQHLPALRREDAQGVVLRAAQRDAQGDVRAVERGDEVVDGRVALAVTVLGGVEERADLAVGVADAQDLDRGRGVEPLEEESSARLLPARDAAGARGGREELRVQGVPCLSKGREELPGVGVLGFQEGGEARVRRALLHPAVVVDDVGGAVVIGDGLHGRRRRADGGAGEGGGKSGREQQTAAHEIPLAWK